MQIEAAERKGLKCHSTSDENEVGKFYQLYRNFYKMKPRRYVPPREYFEQISISSEAKVIVTTLRQEKPGIKKASYENKSTADAPWPSATAMPICGTWHR